MKVFIFLIDLNKVIMRSVDMGASKINENQNKMRIQDENSMMMIGNGLINKVALLTQVLGNINMALQHIQGAVNSHSNAGIASEGNLNRTVRNRNLELGNEGIIIYIIVDINNHDNNINTITLG